MDSLTNLWLRDNCLGGGMPQELEDLNLTALHLPGNSFSGCIPSGLRDVETYDLNGGTWHPRKQKQPLLGGGPTEKCSGDTGQLAGGLPYTSPS